MTAVLKVRIGNCSALRTWSIHATPCRRTASSFASLMLMSDRHLCMRDCKMYGFAISMYDGCGPTRSRSRSEGAAAGAMICFWTEVVRRVVVLLYVVLAVVAWVRNSVGGSCPKQIRVVFPGATTRRSEQNVNNSPAPWNDSKKSVWWRFGDASACGVQPPLKSVGWS